MNRNVTCKERRFSLSIMVINNYCGYTYKIFNWPIIDKISYDSNKYVTSMFNKYVSKYVSIYVSMYVSI